MISFLPFQQKIYTGLILCFSITQMIRAQDAHHVIPLPVSVQLQEGWFRCSETTTITWHDDADSATANMLWQLLAHRYSVPCVLAAHSDARQNVIRFQRKSGGGLPPEGYTLTIGKEYINITAQDGAGLFYGLQTLKQLMSRDAAGHNVNVQAAEITDYPRYSWRGMHLDVARHFFSKEEVMKYLDYLAAYKFNTFHWHLTDDQGWRIEIKKYPRLTEIGAWRKGTLIGHYTDKPAYDTITYGGFYSQQDIREIVAYAGKLHINVVPEIEMPGHVQALLAAYPHLACIDSIFEVGKDWGVFNNVLCPTMESVSFMRDVLKEVMELFPSKYIHIGGDECPKAQWEESEYCQNKIRNLGIRDETALQAYFTSQIDSFVRENGRHIIGWDEILEGGLSQDAAVMCWRSMQLGRDAADAGHSVVMSPTEFCYFDYYQATGSTEPLAIGGYIPLEKVYAFDPLPEMLSEDNLHLILGGQANVWTEYINDFRKLQYMIFPRMCAMSEKLWSQKENCSYSDFIRRLAGYHFKWFEQEGMHFSKAVMDVKLETRKSSHHDETEVVLSTQIPGAGISYSFDHNELDTGQPAKFKTFKKSPVIVPVKSHGVLHAVVRDVEGNRGTPLKQTFLVNLATGKEIILNQDPDPKYSIGGPFSLVNGISGRLPWNGNDWLGFSGTNLVATIDLGKTELISKVSLGLLKAETSWIYLPEEVIFEVSSDGKNFTLAGKSDRSVIEKSGGRNALITLEKTPARYIRVSAINTGIIPPGKPGAGHAAWLFADEVMVE